MQNLKTVCHREEKKRKIENDKTIPPLCTRRATAGGSDICFKSIKLYFEICRHLVGFLREEAGAVRD